MYIISNGELMHHGVKGQKWGVRRYRNKDGSLTPRGKKRAAKLEKKYVKVTGNSIQSSTIAKARSKNINDMSDQELRDTITRINLEREFIDKTSFKKKESSGKKWVKTVGDKTANKVIDKGISLGVGYAAGRLFKK